MRRSPLVALTILLLAGSALSGPLPVEENQRQIQVLQRLTQDIAGEPTTTGKIAVLGRVMREDPSVSVRGKVIDLAATVPGPELEAFFIGLLSTEPDARLRSEMVRTLGKVGSEKCLAALANTAASDPTTQMQLGCIVSQSNARRAAIFAIAELALRHPPLRQQAVAGLRGLVVPDDPRDSEYLADSRAQALYQLTTEGSLLNPFFLRLQSVNPSERCRGVVAFQFCRLSKAPPQIVNALKDPDASVRSSAAMVLGEIGDTQTVPDLMAAATDRSLDTATRANAVGSLGQMKALAAAALMERLLADPDPAIPGNAAVALYRITGRKVLQFPDGYDAD